MEGTCVLCCILDPTKNTIWEGFFHCVKLASRFLSGRVVWKVFTLQGCCSAGEELQIFLYSGIQIFLVIAPTAAAVQICPRAVRHFYRLMDQIKTICAQTSAFSGKFADNLVTHKPEPRYSLSPPACSWAIPLNRPPAFSRGIE